MEVRANQELPSHHATYFLWIVGKIDRPTTSDPYLSPLNELRAITSHEIFSTKLYDILDVFKQKATHSSIFFEKPTGT